MMDEYGNALPETQLALHAQRITAIEVSHAAIMAELKEIRRELSEARGGIRMGKYIAASVVAIASVGAAIYGVVR